MRVTYRLAVAVVVMALSARPVRADPELVLPPCYDAGGQGVEFESESLKLTCCDDGVGCGDNCDDGCGDGCCAACGKKKAAKPSPCGVAPASPRAAGGSAHTADGTA